MRWPRVRCINFSFYRVTRAYFEVLHEWGIFSVIQVSRAINLMPFLVALQFLTIFPVHTAVMPDDQDQASSLEWYGVIGLLIGVVVAIAGSVLDGIFSPSVCAALVLTLWVLITGALHIDGLGDSIDAMFGSSRERSLQIMKDPRCGPMAATGIALILLLMHAGITQIAITGNWFVIIAIPIFARISAQCLLLSTPYARVDGIGSSMVVGMDRERVIIAATVVGLVAFVIIGFSNWYVIAALAILFIGLRSLMIRKLLGCTGDTAGALIVLTEVFGIILVS